MIWLAVALGGAIGATARYLVDVRLRPHDPTAFPLGTFVVNVVGSLLLGVVVGLHREAVLGPAALSVTGAGVLGAFTTYSTFGYETVVLLERGLLGGAARNVAASVAACLAAAGIGLALGAALG